MSNAINRRGFFSKAALSVLGLAIAPKILAKECTVGEAPEGKRVVKKGDSTAKRIEYYLDATEAKGKNKKYEADANCANCRFYRKEKDEGGYAPCTMAANQYVAACGWCKLYRAQKAS
jgi:hypothetical protein